MTGFRPITGIQQFVTDHFRPAARRKSGRPPAGTSAEEEGRQLCRLRATRIPGSGKDGTRRNEVVDLTDILTRGTPRPPRAIRLWDDPAASGKTLGLGKAKPAGFGGRYQVAVGIRDRPGTEPSRGPIAVLPSKKTSRGHRIFLRIHATFRAGERTHA